MNLILDLDWPLLQTEIPSGGAIASALQPVEFPELNAGGVNLVIRPVGDLQQWTGTTVKPGGGVAPFTGTTTKPTVTAGVTGNGMGTLGWVGLAFFAAWLVRGK